MTARKKKYPYYAKWQFFIVIIGLGWITPVTKHWDKFLFWDVEIAYPVQMGGHLGVSNWYYVYNRNGKEITVDFDGGPASYLSYEIAAPKGYATRQDAVNSQKDITRFRRRVYNHIPPPYPTINVYVNPDQESSSFFLNLEAMYDNENLFFPVALQIGMVAFFMAVRYK